MVAKIRSTITGNSLHYVLFADGTPVDAIPGLYGPIQFLVVLGEAKRAAQDCQAGDRTACLVKWHTEKSEEIRKWLQARGLKPTVTTPRGARVAAREAMNRATAKAVVMEAPMLKLIDSNYKLPTQDTWQQLSSGFDVAVLDSRSSGTDADQARRPIDLRG